MKPLEEFDFTFQRSVKNTLIQPLGKLDFWARGTVADLMFMLVTGRCERASIVVAAMIDRLVHQEEIVALKGNSYRLHDRDRPPQQGRLNRTLSRRGTRRAAWRRPASSAARA